MPNPSNIPKLGTPLSREEVVLIEHPKRSDVVKTLQFCADCKTTGGGFGMVLQRLDQGGSQIDPFDPRTAESVYKDIADRTYLVRYGRESEGKFISRVHQAHMPPYCEMRVLQPLTGFLTRNDPNRESHPDWFGDWMDSATVDGKSWDTWLRTEGIPWGLTYPACHGYPGGLPYVIDAAQHTAEIEPERIAQGAEGPTLRTIHPDRLLDWGVDQSGRLDWIKYETTLDNASPFSGHTETRRIRWITADGWCYVDLAEDDTSEEVLVADSGIWPDNFDRAPLGTISFLGGIGIVLPMAPLLHRLFNILSEKTEGERAGCFSVLAYPSTKEVDALTLGSMNALPYDPESRGVPQFLTPDMAPLAHLQTSGETILQQVQEIGGTSSIFGAGVEAAATMAYKFQVTARLLETLHADVERTELEAAEIMAMWENNPLPDKMESPSRLNFDAVDRERYIAEQQEVRDGGFLTPTSKKVQSRQVIDTFDLWGDQEEQKKIEAELEEQAEVDNMADQTPQEAFAEAQGGQELAPAAPPVPGQAVPE